MTLVEYLRKILGMTESRPSQAELNEERQAKKQAQLAAAQIHAGAIDDIIDDVNSPAELVRMQAFNHGVIILNKSLFTCDELLGLSDDPSQALWQMAVMAVSNRSADTELEPRLLNLFDEGGPWHKFFIVQALVTHASQATSLAGELLFKMRNSPKPWLDIQLKAVIPLLTDRLEEGEKPTFAKLLLKLDQESAQSLQAVLTAAEESQLPAATVHPLQAELDQWRATYIDREALKTIGRIWDTESHQNPPVIDHAELAEQVQDVLRYLNQKPRRSVLLSGEHGVGKTAVMRNVGRELMKQGWIIFEAAGSDMTAGQKYIGDLEQRFKTLVQQIGGGRQVLWYVPNFQSLSWSGTHQYSRSSLLDHLLPLLESGEITIVGELPAAACEQLTQDQPRLLTACEIYRIAPLLEEATLTLAAAWATMTKTEKSSSTALLTEETIREAWLLARQYLRDREAPGCLMEFLIQTYRQVQASATGPVQITRENLIATLATMTSLPSQILDERQLLDPEKLRTFFNKRILGQPEAVNCLIERITLLKAGLTDPSRPQGVFLFAGPTGTGKTEIAKALADFLFGSEDRLLRYDMSEFQTPESLERLVGDGQNLDRESLTLKIRKQPFAVILLDEFEKAHPKVWDLFLQVFDDGRLTDPMGRTSDFRHAIVILTSNLGGQAATGTGLGFDQDLESFRATDVDRAIAQAFRPEFLNRLDRVVVFRPFTREIMREILNKELHDIQQRRGLRNRQWDIVWEDSALEFLLDKGFSPTLGARPLKRAIERYLLTPLAETIVKGAFPAGDQFLYIQATEDHLLTEFIDPQAETKQEPESPNQPEVLTGLASIALSPRGTAAEFDELNHRWQQLHQHLASHLWKDAKSLALSMMALPDFWSSTERYAVLGEVEYRERIETGVATMARLLPKITNNGTGSREHYPHKLMSQAAERLHLLQLACESLKTRSPWEAFILVEGKQGPGAESENADEWVTRVGNMYRQWGQRRKMRLTILHDIERERGRSKSLLMAVSGYAAHTILAPENGLHIWEEPAANRNNSSVQYKVLVRVAPMPEDRVAEQPDELRSMAQEIMAQQMAGAPAIVRSYRELPAPLVKDRNTGWRSGRLDRVLAGDFDLLGARAADEAAEGQG